MRWTNKAAALRVSITAFAIAGFAVAVSPQPISAQDYPSRPVRIVVPFAPGAGNDLLGRLVAADLTQRLGQQVYVENKPGGGSQIGTDLAVKSRPDGYTLLWTASDGLSVLPAVKASMPYKVPDDFAFIAALTTMSFAVSVGSKVPVRSMQELVAYGKANPGKLNYGTAGAGSAPHMGGALIANAAGIQMVPVPFGGMGPALNALLAGTVEVALVTTPFARPQAETGAIRVLATTGATRSWLFPEVPTVEQTGLRNASTVIFYGLLAPAGTPDAIVARLRKETGEMAKDSGFIEKLRAAGYQPEYIPGDAYRDFILKDLEQWRGVAKAANISIAN